ncbi:MAG: aminotransferase class I/II-fold pyridoxal phosphate-dependent enzyme, partial [Thermoanaerobaculia bacterium]|nr:aminotransferase class I/II-fold pyridoxal phosphate-dependent enzyme [Thermoanaerobaculia bacterium]
MNRRDLLRTGAVAGLGGFAAWGGGSAAALAQTASAAAPRTRAAGPLHLNANENPLGLAPAAREAIVATIDEANRYPDSYRSRLVEALAAEHGVGAENVVLGNGSTEILQMVVQAAAAPGAVLVTADPTFEAIHRYETPLDYRVAKVPLDGRWAHDLGRMRAAVANARAAVVYVCNPNNPTATLTPSADLDAWIADAPESTLFVVDEAYHEYVRAPGYRSAEQWVAKRPNVVVTRTFSKIYGMAGLRLGYALAHEETAARLAAHMASDNANIMALVAARASLEDTGLIERARLSNQRAKKVVLDCLGELGLEALPSHANFLMHQIGGEVRPYIERMRER